MVSLGVRMAASQAEAKLEKLLGSFTSAKPQDWTLERKGRRNTESSKMVDLDENVVSQAMTRVSRMSMMGAWRCAPGMT